jgi:hypothetical protein
MADDQGTPNLDNGMTQKELVEFWNRTDKQPKAMARELFASRRFTAELEKTVRNLGHYASNKAAAMLSREMGNIQAALIYENICERLYNKLPTFARW